MKKILWILCLVILLVPAFNVSSQENFYNEAPMLSTLVADGQLPPVDERLPVLPHLVQPVDEVGTYGGTWDMVETSGGGGQVFIIRVIGYDNLVSWNPTWTSVVPNIAQSVEASDDASEYTFQLREGMRWSDGEPFTADDIMFWYEDIFLNPDLSPTLTAYAQRFVVNNVPIVIEKVDDYRVTFKFSQPYGLFLYNLAHPLIGAEPTRYPRHYLEQFHADYNSDIDALVEAEGFENWVQLFNAKVGTIGDYGTIESWANPEMPTLHAWVLDEAFANGLGELTATRNPYYWKIDTEFNQLPYIDHLHFHYFETNDEMQTQLLDGLSDMQDRRVSSPSAEIRQLYEENAAAGDYQLFTTLPAQSNYLMLRLNYNHPNLELRSVYLNKDFRIGLSHAINRQRLIDDFLGGNSEPYQMAPRPESGLFNERLAYQYTEYDVDLANDHLDAVGLTNRDEDGFRTLPNGDPLVIHVQITDFVPLWEQMMPYIQTDLAEVGIHIELDLVDRAEMIENYETADATIWTGDGGIEFVVEPQDYLPVEPNSAWGWGWYYWSVDPEDPRAQVPPESVQQQLALYEQLKGVADVDVQNELMGQILDIAADDFYLIGIALYPNGFGIVNNNFHNVPQFMFNSFVYPHPGPTIPAQYFIESDD